MNPLSGGLTIDGREVEMASGVESIEYDGLHFRLHFRASGRVEVFASLDEVIEAGYLVPT